MFYLTLEPGTPAEYTLVMGSVLSGETATPGPVLLGAYLRILRERSGLSLRQAAKHVKLSHPYLSQIESGARDRLPSGKAMAALAKSYDVRLETLEFLGGLREAPPPPPTRSQPLDDREQLRRLLTHPALHDVGIGPTDLRWLSPQVVVAWLRFGRTVEGQVRESGQGIDELIEAYDVGQETASAPSDSQSDGPERPETFTPTVDPAEVDHEE